MIRSPPRTHVHPIDDKREVSPTLRETTGGSLADPRISLSYRHQYPADDRAIRAGPDAIALRRHSPVRRRAGASAPDPRADAPEEHTAADDRDRETDQGEAEP